MCILLGNTNMKTVSGSWRHNFLAMGVAVQVCIAHYLLQHPVVYTLLGIDKSTYSIHTRVGKPLDTGSA